MCLACGAAEVVGRFSYPSGEGFCSERCYIGANEEAYQSQLVTLDEGVE
tara:strand:- start:155 stop:301 length:147 start_codon:yes stop_codon:yes gene_type:complete